MFIHVDSFCDILMKFFKKMFYQQVRKGLYEFLFKLLVLGYLMDSEGRMWKCSNKQLYVIEILQPSVNLPINGPRTVNM